MKLYKFITDWILIIAIVGGVAGYLIFASCEVFDPARGMALRVVEFIQPLLIFAMLFLTFCKVDLSDLHLRRYHWILLAVQVGMYLAIGGIVMALPRCAGRIILEGAMLCFICPTATAGAVIVRKLGGSPANITTYTILINLAVSIVIPATVPLVHPTASMSMIKASLLILSKVFPLLLLPLAGAWLLKHMLPSMHEAVRRYGYLSFEIWVIALALATAVTTRYIIHSQTSLSTDLWLVGVSLVACLLQFYLGRKIGGYFDDKITAGQSLGQKNTVLAIWLGYTFFTPITSVVGGFYSIWHNIINSRQLYVARHHSKK